MYVSIVLDEYEIVPVLKQDVQVNMDVSLLVAACSEKMLLLRERFIVDSILESHPLKY